MEKQREYNPSFATNQDKAWHEFHQRVVKAKVESIIEKGLQPVDDKDPNLHERKPEEIAVFPIPSELRPRLPQHAELIKSIGINRQEIQDKMRLLQAQEEELARNEKAIRQIPILFDVPNFTVIANNLRFLKNAGVEEIQMGEGDKKKTYEVASLISVLDKVRDYSRSLGKSNTVIKWETVDEDLRLMGVTRRIISSFSALSFRDSMIQCIVADVPGRVVTHPPEPEKS